MADDPKNDPYVNPYIPYMSDPVPHAADPVEGVHPPRQPPEPLEDGVEGTALIKPSTTDHALYEPIIEACRSVYDPEVPVNIYDLGLIYTIDISDEGDVLILMSLTAPGCPVAGEMPGWIADVISPLPGVKTVDVRLIWEPQWGMDMMTDEARLELGFM
jgi:FeS assembly SUF system protein